MREGRCKRGDSITPSTRITPKIGLSGDDELQRAVSCMPMISTSILMELCKVLRVCLDSECETKTHKFSPKTSRCRPKQTALKAKVTPTGKQYRIGTPAYHTTAAPSCIPGNRYRNRLRSRLTPFTHLLAATSQASSLDPRPTGIPSKGGDAGASMEPAVLARNVVSEEKRTVEDPQ